MNFHENVMNTAELKNQRLMEILEVCQQFADDKVLRWMPLPCKNQEREKWMNHEYMRYVADLGDKHDGYPPSMRAYSLTMKQIKFNKDAPAEIQDAIYKKAIDLECQLIAELGVKRNALWAIYPPGGYIAWHNNANAPGYNILLTWSENGDGYWEHLDPKTGEVVRINDVPGWQCKYGYYGSYHEGVENLCYHAASTECWRMTIAFVFNADERGKQMAEMVIEELSEP